jgi:hypothetical protein
LKMFAKGQAAKTPAEHNHVKCFLPVHAPNLNEAPKNATLSSSDLQNKDQKMSIFHSPPIWRK